MTPVARPPRADFAKRRREMVRTQVAGRDVRDPRVLAAMGTVPRERFVPAALAERALERCRALGYTSIHLRHGDGTLGWAEHAPYDAITVAAGGPEVPQTLLAQLALRGRLIIPVGRDPRAQTLVRITRSTEEECEREDLCEVCFVPLIGAEGWKEEPSPSGSGGDASEARAPEPVPDGRAASRTATFPGSRTGSR